MKNKFLLIFFMISLIVGSISVYGGFFSKINSLETVKNYTVLDPILDIEISMGTLEKTSTLETDKVFNKLNYNNLKGNDASFDVNIDTTKTDNTVSFIFNEICGKVLDYKLYKIENCTKNIETYTYKDIEIYNDVNKTYNKQQIIDKIINTPTETICENEIPKDYNFNNGINNVKIVADIQDEICYYNNNIGTMGHSIDWIPVIKGTNSDIFIQEKWAFWNSTGGNTINYDGLYTVVTFTSNGTLVVDGSINATVLVVAGGGSGGSLGGGGGAGGLIYNTSVALSTGNYSIKIGNGGSATTVASAAGNNGSNSSFGNSAFNLTAKYGAGGGAQGLNGQDGGSGGGAGITGSGAGGLGTSGQGNNGGSTTSGSPYPAGGGGGAGAVGGNGVGSTSGAGGYGINYSINGSIVCYAGGGGAPGTSQGASAGSASCGGGAGSLNTGTSGTANTGGGGGATGNGVPSPWAGAAGGSGVVIIRYLTSNSNSTFINLDTILNKNISFLINTTTQTNCTYNGTNNTFIYTLNNTTLHLNISSNGTLYFSPLLNETGSYNIQVGCILASNTSVNTSTTFLYTINNNINNYTTVYNTSNSQTLYGLYTNFIINISNLYGLNYTSANLVYNGTIYSTAIKTETTGYTMFNQSILNNIDLGNFTYYWNIIGNQPSSSGGNFIYITNTTNHTVANISNITVFVRNTFSSVLLDNFKVYVNSVNVCNATIGIYNCTYTPANLSNMTVYINATGYSNYTILTNFKTFIYPNITYGVYPFTIFNFLDETTYGPFQMNSTLGIRLTIICPAASYVYDMNISANASNIFTIPLVCPFTDFNVYVTYGTASYLRNLIYPSIISGFTSINIYLMNLNTLIPGYVSAVNIDFALDDTLSQYPNPSLIINKYINNSYTQITGGRVDMSGKVTTYLIQNNAYIIDLYSNDVFVKQLGQYFSSTSGTLPIRLYDILFGVDPNGFNADVRYDIYNDNVTYSGNTYIISNYNDSALQTSSVIFNVFDESITGALLYTQTSTANSVQFLYNITSYPTLNLVCMLNMTSHGINIIYTLPCQDKTDINLDILSYVDPQIINWFFIILISVLALYATIRTANVMALIIVGMASLFTYFGWLNIGRGLLAVALLVAFINYLADRNKEQ